MRRKKATGFSPENVVTDFESLTFDQTIARLLWIIADRSTRSYMPMQYGRPIEDHWSDNADEFEKLNLIYNKFVLAGAKRSKI